MAETIAYACHGQDGYPLAAMFTGPAADALAEAWLARVAANRDEIKARAARRAAGLRPRRRTRAGEVAR